MSRSRTAALAGLGLVYLSALWPGVITGASWVMQNREHISEPPGRDFPLGTDDLGRDRFARLLYGTRTSLSLAPAAALLSTGIAAFAGIACGYLGGRFERTLLFVVDLFVSTPWLFLLLTARALLPLNVQAWTSVAVTFGLLGALGWAHGVRVIAAAARNAVRSDYVVQARAAGVRPWRLLYRHSLPNVRSVIIAQFWIAVPLFVLAEANLSMLGLGVSEPLPSLGNLMTELQNYAAVIDQPWLLAPAVLLMLIMGGLQMAMPKEG